MYFFIHTIYGIEIVGTIVLRKLIELLLLSVFGLLCFSNVVKGNLAKALDDAKELFDRTPNHVEGGADGGWTCIDFGDVIVNVMTPSSREFYNIDEIWKNAEQVDLSDVVSPEGPDDLLDDEDLFDEEDDLEDFWDAPNAPDAW